MNARIYLSSPDIGKLEEQAVSLAMKSGWVAPLGPEVDAFEQEIAIRVGVNYGIALSSGTGAIPFFVDSDIETGNISPELLRNSIQKLRSENKQIAAIVPVDLLGKAIDYTTIQLIADEYEIPLLCDAAESLGATHKDKPAGSWGTASIVSFNGNKIMTTSGGGMLLTDNEQIANKVRYLATQARQPFLHYEHTEVGYNYRLSNLLAALGRAQLSRLDLMIAKRRNIRNLYRELFDQIDGVRIFDAGNDAEDNCWLTSIIIDSEVTGWASNEMIDYLSQFNIETRPLWKPMHLQPLFSNSENLINGSSEKLFQNGLTLPSGSALRDEQIHLVLEKIRTFSD
jgi:dTDP-4-amino-4,6-dideoxygalactose transaminase